METKTKVFLLPQKGETKQIPFLCNVCDDVTEHTANYRKFDPVSRLVIFERECSRCKIRATYKNSSSSQVITTYMDKTTFANMWQEDWF